MIWNMKTVIDLYPHKITIMRCKTDRDRVEVLDYQELILDLGYYHPESLKYEYDVGLIQDVIKSMKIKGSQVWINLLLDEVITRVIEIPILSAKDLENLIQNNTADYLTVVPEDYIVKHKRMGPSKEGESSRDRVMLAAIPKTVLHHVEQFFDDCGLKPKVIDVFANSMSRLFQDHQQEVLGILLIEPKQSHFLILEHGQVFMHATFNPEAYQPSYLLSDDEQKNHSEISETEVLANLLSYLNFYSASRYGAVVDQVLVLGRSGSLASLIAEQYDLRATSGLSPLVLEVSTKEFVEFQTDSNASLLGLALRGLRQKSEINFVKKSNPTENKGLKLQKSLLLIGSVPVIVTGLWVYYPSYVLKQDQEKLQVLQAKSSLYSGLAIKKEDLTVMQDVYHQKQLFRQYILDQDVPVSSYLRLLQDILPQDITLSQVTMKKGILSISCNLDTPLQAARLIASINQSGYFEEIRSASVPLHETPYTYSLDLKLIRKLGG